MALNDSQCGFWKQCVNQERRTRSAFAQYQGAASTMLHRGHGPHRMRVTCLTPQVSEQSDDFVLDSPSVDGAGQRVPSSRPLGVRFGNQHARQDAMNPLIHRDRSTRQQTDQSRPPLAPQAGSGIVGGDGSPSCLRSRSRYKTTSVSSSTGGARMGLSTSGVSGSGSSAVMKLRTKEKGIKVAHPSGQDQEELGCSSSEGLLRHARSPSPAHSVTSTQRGLIETHNRLSSLEQAFHSHRESTSEIRDQVAEVKQLLKEQLLSNKEK